MYNEEMIRKAMGHVKIMEANYSGTELLPALEYTFRIKTKQQVNGKPIPVAVFVLTDGEVGDTSGIVSTVSQAVADAKRQNGLLRVFVVGIGDDVSRDVCEGIAGAGNGIAVYVGVSAALTEPMSLFDYWSSELWHSPSQANSSGRTSSQ